MNSLRIFRESARLACAALLVLTMASCANFGKNRGGNADDINGQAWNRNSGSTPLPERNESVSFAGPGSDTVNRELFPPVFFGFDSSKVGTAELAKIDNVARYLKSQPGGTLIVAGFTDTVGSAEYNRQLGEIRALSVRTELLRRGVPASHVQTVSFGEDLPAAAGTSASANAANRRVEFGVVR
jgi:peptidoglycan-associated lipoprotein